MYYKNKTHQKIFEEQLNGNPCKCPNEYLATLYLLTADRDLWRAAKYEIERKVIDFSKIRLKEYTTNNYTVFIVAKDIYHGGNSHSGFKDHAHVFIRNRDEERHARSSPLFIEAYRFGMLFDTEDTNAAISSRGGGIGTRL